MKKKAFHQFFKGLKGIPFEVSYWDDSKENFGEGEPRFKLIFREEVSLAKFIKEPVMTFGEGYMNGHIEVEGSLEEMLKLANINHSVFWTKAITRWNKLTSIGKQKENVQHHYDVGNAFYAIWLDPSMSYSCAYFKTPEDSLEQAQKQKIDHVLRKLQLKSGETLLDIGCGWGGLIIRAALEYGVKAKGITLSEEQYKKVQERIIENGLQGQVEVELISYQELAAPATGAYDKISSVGMFEHVGQANYPHFMKAVDRLLKDQGVAVLHTITHPIEQKPDPWIEKYIFPGGYIPSLREIVNLLPEYNFHVTDIESLRIHYAMTLDHWADAYDAHEDQVREMYGEKFVRMWRLYLRASASAFRRDGINLHQIVFTKGLNNQLALTRDFLYNG
ncbi:class I SAM-dependent methyltransferase [Paenibacillus psychroresistens]|uniref:Class I SAM-dependent methyltransferase n=1 Tax=Paenibacillus psychroresistens TaxID=1778678 RepID=A0A6B8RVA2_9BACL|nr:cyclopropane-fatty-acyl-phospholipid synthase family protein [Paenibacillus psychroresistens]QGQ99555.1 class I SAM-dependent methyltransferase [Paenibacillus psychroresistens]